jgi:hypothetical protein
VRKRAERRLGDQMAAQRETVELATGTRGQLIGPGIIGGVSDTPPITRRHCDTAFQRGSWALRCAALIGYERIGIPPVATRRQALQ